MSAKIRVVPREQRLRVTAKYAHETLQFNGDIFQFLEHLMKERLTGVGTFRLNIGHAYGLEFDLRQLVPECESESKSGSRDVREPLTAGDAQP